MTKETELYAPVKSLLEDMGYEVKAEVNDCDVVALKGDDVVVVELKLAFTLDLAGIFDAAGNALERIF